MGVNRRGLMAAITNYRDPAANRAGAPSRGLLVSNFLAARTAPETYLGRMQSRASDYNGFNLLVGDGQALFYYANREDRIRSLAPGMHGLSNHLLDTPWTKVEQGIRRLAELTEGTHTPDAEAIFRMLADRTPAPRHQLPDTGVGLVMERLLSPRFITSPDYGTRSSSILLMSRRGEVSFLERTFVLKGSDPHIRHTCRVDFTVSP